MKAIELLKELKEKRDNPNVEAGMMPFDYDSYREDDVMLKKAILEAKCIELLVDMVFQLRERVNELERQGRHRDRRISEAFRNDNALTNAVLELALDEEQKAEDSKELDMF